MAGAGRSFLLAEVWEPFRVCHRVMHDGELGCLRFGSSSSTDGCQMSTLLDCVSYKGAQDAIRIASR